jgi:acyl-CoA thioester hydrolase
MTFTHRHRVRSYEVDHQGIVFHGRYLEMADAAMTAFFEQHGTAYPQMISGGFDPAVVAVDLRFSAPARLSDDLDVAVTSRHSSFVLRFHFRRDGAELAVVTTTYVNVTAGAASSTPVPEPFRAQITSAIEQENVQP